MDTDADGRWMTYEELAEVRGIDRHSARRLASRLKWQRQKDNQQIVRVYVPVLRAEPDRRRRDMPADRPQDISHAVSALQAAFEVALSAKDGEIATLRETVTTERGRADRAVAAMEGLNGHLADLGAKLADAQAELVGAQTAQGEAEADAAELSQVEAERRARGLWRVSGRRGGGVRDRLMVVLLVVLEP
jgi:chromosome segregation ATPase